MRNQINKIRSAIEKNKIVHQLASCFPLLFVIGLAALFSYFGYSIYQAHLGLLKGQQVEAVVDNEYVKITNRSKVNNVSVRIKYTFLIEEKSYSGEAEIPQYPTSQHVTVIYDPSDPSNNKTQGTQDSFEQLEFIFTPAGAIIAAAIFVAIGLALIRIIRKFRPSFRRRSNPEVDSYEPQRVTRKLSLPSEDILWLEKHILIFNREMYGDDRPTTNLAFLQKFPRSLLERENIEPSDVEAAALNLISQTKLRLEHGGNRKWEVPFRNPKVEFSHDLPTSEPGHIEFGNDHTRIRIHPKFRDDPFSLAAILCHELAHFILDHNGLRKNNSHENEKLTDLFVFKCGQGLIYLEGVVDLIEENGQMGENRLGYLTLDEMTYAHVRCSSQFGISENSISPAHFKGRGFSYLPRVFEFLRLKETKGSHLSEIILCKENHILRISPLRESASIRCPKCGWQDKIWLHKSDQLRSVILAATEMLDSENYAGGLLKFRDAQRIDTSSSVAFCGAARCLKRMGQHQDAIRELKKFLSVYPEDKIAISEMKNLIY